MSKSLQVVASRGFSPWLATADVSVVFSTYRMGKIFFLGRKTEQRLSVFERTFSGSMGIWTDTQTLWLASAYQVWRFENMLPRGKMDGEFDALYVPLQSTTTGDLKAHDVTVDQDGQVYFVSSLFSCVAKLDPRQSFSPYWRPAFVSELVPEDRCHLNGLCCVDGRPRFVTACAQTDANYAWRERKRDGGCVVDMESNEVIVEGLSMPHSPRYADGRLWLLNSGLGQFGYVDRRAGRFEPVAFCPGFARGLAIVGQYAIVGLSRPRDSTFLGLELDRELAQHSCSPICGLALIDIERGEVVHQVHVLGDIEELYDVAALPGIRCPKALGQKTAEIRNNVWFQDGEESLRFSASDGR